MRETNAECRRLLNANHSVFIFAKRLTLARSAVLVIPRFNFAACLRMNVSFSWFAHLWGSSHLPRHRANPLPVVFTCWWDTRLLPMRDDEWQLLPEPRYLRANDYRARFYVKTSELFDTRQRKHICNGDRSRAFSRRETRSLSRKIDRKQDGV